MSRGISGNQGYAMVGSSEIEELTGWTMDRDPGTQTYNAHSGAGWQKTTTGNKKISGTITGKYDPDDPVDSQIATDSLVTLQLHHTSTDYWTGSARLGAINLSANIDTGEVQSWTCAFESDGAWSHTTP